MTTTTKINDGTYFLHPEGSGWIGAEYRNGRYVGRIEESNAATHAAANDHYAGTVPSESDQDVDVATAEAIIRDVMGEDTCADMVVVLMAAEKGMSDATIKIDGVDVELTWRDGVGIGQAVHVVRSQELKDGVTHGPRDGEEFEFHGKTYKLGSHDYDDQGEVTVCAAEVYEAE